jgi:hypothetical protein
MLNDLIIILQLRRMMNLPIDPIAKRKKKTEINNQASHHPLLLALMMMVQALIKRRWKR